jgi:transcriptional regulator with XRE-family HTH domain
MPRLKTETAELRAANLTKSYIKNGMNQSAVARKEGVTASAINQRFKHLPTATPLQEALRKIGITTQYKARKFKELLEATRLQSINFNIHRTPDNNTRSSILKLLCQVGKDIDGDKNGSPGVKIVNIIHNYREKNAGSS